MVFLRNRQASFYFTLPSLIGLGPRLCEELLSKLKEQADRSLMILGKYTRPNVRELSGQF